VLSLDDPGRVAELRWLIGRKSSLRRFYRRAYRGYAASLARCPGEGGALELGSGAGFAKEVVAGLVTSEIQPCPGVDRVVDARSLPFPDQSLRFICMTDVLHHIPDVEAFFHEAERCLAPGGRVFIVDQHPGWISTPILRWVHHEPFDPCATTWRFESGGPLSGANGALPWLVFVRDRERFEALFPRLKVVRYEPHTPLGYWLSGGLKRWNLLPCGGGAVEALDRCLTRLAPALGSFVDIELLRVD